MSAKSQSLAKSLHTVSVLVNVAQHLARNDYSGSRGNPRVAVAHALNVLGYADAADPYGLAAKAVAILEAGNVR